MRNMSFAMTIPQVLDGSKTVTRRLGWRGVRRGDRLRGVERAMGLGRGETIRALREIEIVSVTEERLDAITPVECAREGLPDMTPAEFVAMFCAAQKCTPATTVRRIEFRYVG